MSDHARAKLETREVRYIQPSIGSKINPDYENGKKYTPMQKMRIGTVTIAALAILGAVGCIIAAALASITPLFVVAVPLALAGASLLAYGLTRKDLDLPEERQKMCQQIAALAAKRNCRRI